MPNDITGEDAGLLRADHRLRGHEDPALDVREVPRRRRHADDADEERRRGDGDRPHLQGVVQKALRSLEVKGRTGFAPRPGCRPARRGRARVPVRSKRCAAARPNRAERGPPWLRYAYDGLVRLELRSHDLTASTRGSSTRSPDRQFEESSGGRAHRLAKTRAVRRPSSWASATRSSPTCRAIKTDSRPPCGAASGHPSGPTRLVDTCAAEFEAYTPYYYSTYGDETRCASTTEKRIVILGGGPNRIGQGIEFDYCCVHAAFALRELGIETIMVNSNPETVSTDYDTSDLLFFEPLTLEDVLNICDEEQARRRDRAVRRADAAEPGEGPRRPPACRSSAPAVDSSTGRGPRAFQASCSSGWASSSRRTASPRRRRGLRGSPHEIGYPVLVRPSYVLGGRAMEIVYDDER
jgi:hypothetical protein